MTGPEHYREAERLLNLAADGDEVYGATDAEDSRVRSDARELAQAHAALALAAATALQAALPLVGDDQQVTDWGQAIGADLATNQGARITNALSIVDELDRLGVIAPGSAHNLRIALGATGGDR